MGPHVSGGTRGISLRSVTLGSALGRSGISTGSSTESGYSSSLGCVRSVLV